MDKYQQEVFDNLTERLQNGKYRNNQVLTSSQLVGMAIRGKAHLRKVLGSYPSGKDRLRRYASIAIGNLTNEGVLEHISHRTYLFKTSSQPASPQPSPQSFDLFSNEEEVEMYDHVEVSEAEVNEAEEELETLLVASFVEEEGLTDDVTFEDDLGVLRSLVNNEALCEVMDVLERHTVNLSEITEIANQALAQYDARKDKPVEITFDSIKDQLEKIAEVSAKVTRIKNHFA